jgi:hypothetical protein
LGAKYAIGDPKSFINNPTITGQQAIVSPGRTIIDNKDGTYTAYFGYENRSPGEVTVTRDAGKNTLNQFSAGDADRGQPVTFLVGRKYGVVAVKFDGRPLTWTLRGPGSAVSMATASSSSTPCKRITPIVGCINGSANGLVVTLGYDNPNPFDIILPVGPLNYFATGPANLNQPKYFKSGRNSGAFTVEFKTQVLWNLDGVAAKANSKTPICLNGCVETPLGSIRKELNQTAMKLAELTNLGAQKLTLAAKKRAAQGQIAKNSASQVGIDAKRAMKKAQMLSARAQSITLGFPTVIRSCPNTPKLCQSVDRSNSILALSGLFDDLLDQLKRIMARGNFNLSGKTKRDDPLVVEAKTVRAKGDIELSRIPRVETVCG